jgi:hypothetical protein
VNNFATIHLHHETILRRFADAATNCTVPMLVMWLVLQPPSTHNCILQCRSCLPHKEEEKVREIVPSGLHPSAEVQHNRPLYKIPSLSVEFNQTGPMTRNLVVRPFTVDQVSRHQSYKKILHSRATSRQAVDPSNHASLFAVDVVCLSRRGVYLTPIYSPSYSQQRLLILQ